MKQSIFFRVQTALNRMGNLLESEDHITQCSSCGQRICIWSEPVLLDLFDRDPQKWPSMIQTDCAPGFAVSSMMASELQQAGINFVALETICQASKLAPTNYHILQPPRAVDLDLSKSGLIYSSVCKTCGFAPIKKIPIYWREVLENQSWNGELLFRVKNVAFDHVYCSLEFVELARKRRWKSFRFIPLPLKVPPGEVLPAEATSGIDFLGKNWPPAYLSWGQDDTWDGKGQEVPAEWSENLPVRKESWWKIW